jgi:hypothetical protein
MVVLKISLGIFFRRIVVRRSQIWTIYCTIGFVCLMGTANLFFVIFRCGNPNGYFIAVLKGTCVPLKPTRFMLYMNAAVSTASDFIFATLPIVLLRNANMDKRTKASVAFILLLALMGSISSCIRLVYLEGLLKIHDFFWSATNTAIWSTIEPGTGIIAASLATMRPLFRILYFKMRGLSVPSSDHSSNAQPGSTRSHPKTYVQTASSQQSNTAHSISSHIPLRNDQQETYPNAFRSRPQSPLSPNRSDTNHDSEAELLDYPATTWSTSPSLPREAVPRPMSLASIQFYYPSSRDNTPIRSLSYPHSDNSNNLHHYHHHHHHHHLNNDNDDTDKTSKIVQSKDKVTHPPIRDCGSGFWPPLPISPSSQLLAQAGLRETADGTQKQQQQHVQSKGQRISIDAQSIETTVTDDDDGTSGVRRLGPHFLRHE